MGVLMSLVVIAMILAGAWVGYNVWEASLHQDDYAEDHRAPLPVLAHALGNDAPYR